MHRRSGSAPESTCLPGPWLRWRADLLSVQPIDGVPRWLCIRAPSLYAMPQPVRPGRGFPTMSTHAKTRIVGSSALRKEGVDKLLGRARYVDDIERESMWHGTTVRSTIPRGLIRSVKFGREVDWTEFAVVTAADIPGQNHIQLIFADQPCLADGAVNHCDEAIVLLAHADKCKLREAAAAVKI